MISEKLANEQTWGIDRLRQTLSRTYDGDEELEALHLMDNMIHAIDAAGPIDPHTPNALEEAGPGGAVETPEADGKPLLVIGDKISELMKLLKLKCSCDTPMGVGVIARYTLRNGEAEVATAFRMPGEEAVEGGVNGYAWELVGMTRAIAQHLAMTEIYDVAYASAEWHHGTTEQPERFYCRQATTAEALEPCGLCAHRGECRRNGFRSRPEDR
jgi:hypothetical protein